MRKKNKTDRWPKSSNKNGHMDLLYDDSEPIELVKNEKRIKRLDKRKSDYLRKDREYDNWN